MSVADLSTRNLAALPPPDDEQCAKLLLRNNRLDLGSDRLAASLARYAHLRVLDLSGNATDAAPAPALWGGVPLLEELSLARCGLSEAPRGLSALPRLRVLKLQDNALVAIAADTLEGLGALTLLDLSHNRLEALPAGLLAAVPALQRLNVSHNRLAALPGDVGALAALQFLSADENALESLPAEAAQLASLAHLSLTSNRLQALPEGVFSELQSLEMLELSHNALTELPSDIGASPLLELVYLSHNQLATVPESLFASPKIAQICIDFNPMTHLPLAALKLDKLDHFVDLGVGRNAFYFPEAPAPCPSRDPARPCSVCEAAPATDGRTTFVFCELAGHPHMALQTVVCAGKCEAVLAEQYPPLIGEEGEELPSRR